MTSYVNKTAQIHSYYSLRNAVGCIGVLLPFVLLLGDAVIFKHHGLRVSISNYYCSPMRDVLVGSLCAVALFLFFYKGYVEDALGKWDNRATNIAGTAAIGIALFPTTCGNGHCPSELIHLICGSVFFVTLSLISLCLFTRTRKNMHMTRRKKIGNHIYRACGIIILLCTLTMGLYFLLFYPEHHDACVIYFSETIALIAFGISWLTKGKFLRQTKRSYRTKVAEIKT